MKRNFLLLLGCFTSIMAAALPKNFEKIQKNAYRGNEKACFEYAEFFRNGADGIDVNIDTAIVYYKVAAAKNKMAAAYAGELLRTQYLSGGTDKKTFDESLIDESIRYLLLYLDKNKKKDPKYELILAENYLTKSIFYSVECDDCQYKKSADSIFHIYKDDGLSIIRLAKNGNDLIRGLETRSIDSLDYALAVRFVINLEWILDYFLPDDEVNAIKYYCLYHSVDKGEAEFRVARFYKSRLKNTDKAFEHYIKSTDLGYAKAYGETARILVDKKKYREAIPYALKAVEYEDDIANNQRIANLYFNTSQNEKAFPYWKRLADLKYTAGNIRLGQAYQNGVGVEKNDSLAIVNYEIGLQDNEWPWAQCELAKLYEGQISKASQNRDKAILWYEKSAQQNYMEAKLSLAKLIRDSDPHKALMLADECIEIKDYKHDAWVLKSEIIGDSIMSSLIATNNYDELKKQRKFLACSGERDFTICKVLSDQDYFDETYDLAYAYMKGVLEYTDYLNNKQSYNIDADSIKGFNLLLKAYKLHPNDQNLRDDIAFYYTYGKYVKQNLDEARKIYNEGRIGDKYVEKYYDQWRIWQIRKGDIETIITAFELKQADALWVRSPGNLSTMPLSEAIKWLQIAASKGNKKQKGAALYELGFLYEEGRYGVKIDYAKAISSFKQSVALDNAEACYHLGWIYGNGKCGEKVNLSAAAEYYHKCYQLSGDDDAWTWYMHYLSRSL